MKGCSLITHSVSNCDQPKLGDGSQNARTTYQNNYISSSVVHVHVWNEHADTLCISCISISPTHYFLEGSSRSELVKLNLCHNTEYEQLVNFLAIKDFLSNAVCSIVLMSMCTCDWGVSWAQDNAYVCTKNFMENIFTMQWHALM